MSKLIATSVDARAVHLAFSKLPKEVQREIRQTFRPLSNELAKDLKSVHGVKPPQYDLIEVAITPKTDRQIRVAIGGTKKVGRPYKRYKKFKGRDGNVHRSKFGIQPNYRAPAGALIHGVESGSSGKTFDRTGRRMGNRFKLQHNPRGYFIRPTVDRFAPELYETWKRTIIHAARRVKLDGGLGNG
jgi:hypothetical protein